ncbi:hypothetical protein PUR71_28835 [Streptomyces sp. SP17BM10]|uniref:DUF6932 family protein n=1 Tax=Streptomyces sp. SP17BM10 TaxID=3002530 RepID=UPI002E792D13|nr:hypothetical protein [Streptomyces sp. SP17BM10]MEE1786880.1 hypothetical protein [Streptomyces sp. SP17BM10]
MLHFDDQGHLVRGRHQMDIEEARDCLVDAPCFRDSGTRGQLWDGFERFLARFLALEEIHRDVLEGQPPLIHCVWLGGSYVSAKLDPRNIDATFFMDVEVEDALRGKEGAGWLTKAFKSWKSIQTEYGVTPLRVGYRRVATVFRPDEHSAVDQEYFRDRGRWDDWWQRRRLEPPADPRPTVESAVPVRGYLEVTL